MRTLFWTCVLALLFLPCVAAQDLEQLRKIVEDNRPKGALPPDLGSRAVPQALIDSCLIAVDAANQIYALPNLDEATRRWTLQREVFARIPLAYHDAQTHYARLTSISDELDQLGPKELAKLAEEHVLKIGILVAVQTGNNVMNINLQSLGERLVMFAMQHPGQDSMLLIDIFLREVRAMKAHYQRDRRLAVLGPIFQDYYRSIHRTAHVRALDTDIRRATLPGNPMTLRGVELDGREFNLNSMLGKVVLIQFWGTWCGPCKAEMPNLIALHDKYRAAGFEVIGINTGESGDDVAKVRQFRDNTLFNGKRIPWTILHEGLNKRQNPNRETTTEFYGITDVPVLILVGRDGKVLHLHPQPSALDALIAEATSPMAMFEWTEEEKKIIEENQRLRAEEDSRLLQEIRPRTPASPQ